MTMKNGVKSQPSTDSNGHHKANDHQHCTHDHRDDSPVRVSEDVDSESTYSSDGKHKHKRKHHTHRHEIKVIRNKKQELLEKEKKEKDELYHAEVKRAREIQQELDKNKTLTHLEKLQLRLKELQEPGHNELFRISVELVRLDEVEALEKQILEEQARLKLESETS